MTAAELGQHPGAGSVWLARAAPEEAWRRMKMEWVVEVRDAPRSSCPPWEPNGRSGSPARAVRVIYGALNAKDASNARIGQRAPHRPTAPPSPTHLFCPTLPQWPLFKQRWRIVLFGLLMQYVHGVFTQLAHRMHQPSAEPLRDVGFELTPVGGLHAPPAMLAPVIVAR
jgi:hypothetical protein